MGVKLFGSPIVELREMSLPVGAPAPRRIDSVTDRRLDGRFASRQMGK